MGQPVLRRGQWWYEQPDGSWLLWNEAAGEWQAAPTPPPPPEASELTPAPAQATPATGAPAQDTPQSAAQAPGALASGPAPQQGAPATQHTTPDPSPSQTPASGGERVPGGPPYAGQSQVRIPADSLMVSESHVVSTQQRGAHVTPPSDTGQGRMRHLAPNVTQVDMPSGLPTQTPASPLHQVRSMAALKLTDAERVAAERRLEVLAGCLVPGERLAGMAMGTEQATGVSGIIAVSNRQILFVGKPAGELQLFSPLENIELVGYEDLGGVARLSVTAQGRVTTWRDIMPTARAAELSQLIENKGAMAKAVVPPVEAVAGLGAYEQPTSVVSAGDVSVQHYGPPPSEIVMPDTQTHRDVVPKREWERDWKDKTRDFIRGLTNDPGSTPRPAYVGGTRPGLGVRGKLRLRAAGSIVVGLISTSGWALELWIALAAIALLLGMSAYGQNRRSVRDTMTEGLAIAGVLVGAISLTIALLRYF